MCLTNTSVHQLKCRSVHTNNLLVQGQSITPMPFLHRWPGFYRESCDDIIVKHQSLCFRGCVFWLNNASIKGFRLPKEDTSHIREGSFPHKPCQIKKKRKKKQFHIAIWTSCLAFLVYNTKQDLHYFWFLLKGRRVLRRQQTAFSIFQFSKL